MKKGGGCNPSNPPLDPPMSIALNVYSLTLHVWWQICGALAEEGKSLEEIHQVASSAAKNMGMSGVGC